MNHPFKLLIPCLTLCLLLAACGTDQSSGEVPQQPGQSQTETSTDAGTAADSTAGILANFSTQTLAGETVDNTMLSGYKITMVNVWATFCGPCIQEMPDLGTLSAEYAGKGVQIVGLVSDVLNSDATIDQEQVDLAKEIVSSTGAGYPHLLPSPELIQSVLLSTQVVPTTFFVDETGQQIGETITGSRSADQWRSILDAMLAEHAG